MTKSHNKMTKTSAIIKMKTENKKKLKLIQNINQYYK